MRQHSQTQQPREKSERPSSASNLVKSQNARRLHQRQMSLAASSLPRRHHQRTPSDASGKVSPPQFASLDRRASRSQAFQRGHARKTSVISIEGFLGDSTDDVAPNLLPCDFPFSTSLAHPAFPALHPTRQMSGPMSPYGTIGWSHLETPALMQRRGSLQQRPAPPIDSPVRMPSASGDSSPIQEECTGPHVSTLVEQEHAAEGKRRGSFLQKCATLFTTKKTAVPKTVTVK